MRAYASARITWPSHKRVTPLGLVEAETEEELAEQAAELAEITGAVGVLQLDVIEQAPAVFLIRDVRDEERVIAAFEGADEYEAHQKADAWLISHPTVRGMYEVLK